MKLIHPKSFCWDSPVEDDPTWVKLMTCALRGHQWVPHETLFSTGKRCTKCDSRVVFDN
jgi:hypothetical protein